jgi:hypothetical protein
MAIDGRIRELGNRHTALTGPFRMSSAGRWLTPPVSPL